MQRLKHVDRKSSDDLNPINLNSKNNNLQFQMFCFQVKVLEIL